MPLECQCVSVNNKDQGAEPAVADSGSITRRTFLAGSAAVAVTGAALVACSRDDDTAEPGSTPSSGVAGTTPPTDPATAIPATAPPTVPATVPPASTAAPTTTGAPVLGSLADIEHFVILFQENRSFDHYFGTRPGVAGFASTPEGKNYRNDFSGHPDGYLLPYHTDSTVTSAQCGPDPDHSWAAQHGARNNGTNDGFASSMGAHALGYFNRVDIPYYWALADQFTLCDHYFCSVTGPTNPNRHMAMTGTIDPAGLGGGPATDNSGTSYTWQTYPERLQQAGITWRVYHEVDDYDDNNLKFFAQFQGLSTGNPLYDNALVNLPADAFELDAAAGNLPQVSWLVAPTVISEHPPWAPSVGENFTASKIAAVMANPALWAKTAFILSYDENGGFFDHMPAPTADRGTADEYVNAVPLGMGFRVPTMVVSPWTRRADGGDGATGARVSTTVFDHTSILRLLETRFGVEAPLISQWRRDNSGDLSDVFDFTTYDDSVPTLPVTADRAAQYAVDVCGDLPPATVPDVQAPATLDS
ncbi:MAG: Non-hemolytic phospholipase [Ilumatobacteraceae bacterium]|nr:Non-hemolytic phospholipase [Ilumatobacteraceae bacterium]